MSDDANRFLTGGGVTSFKFAKPGDTVSGRIARDPDLSQMRGFQSQKPLYWDGKNKVEYDTGKPCEQLRVILDTDLNESEGDDGERAIYLKGSSKKAVQNALKTSGAKGLHVGGLLSMTFTGLGPRVDNLNPAKLFSATYEAPANEPAESDDAPDDDGGTDDIEF